ncbi:hypothetical protein BJ878DRAFT_119551 [Calycina marina]|uniref:Uncharacterized protein n=1 Tax=Calycina marina TaxID=1763456 RepID=A0A9P7Z1Y0_9HELO|nr:hypothetical protein BJ878DRAFT_119551 [Calycina marina]
MDREGFLSAKSPGATPADENDYAHREQHQTTNTYSIEDGAIRCQACHEIWKIDEHVYARDHVCPASRLTTIAGGYDNVIDAGRDASTKEKTPESGVEESLGQILESDELDLDPIRPYVDRKRIFEYYEPIIPDDDAQTSNLPEASGNEEYIAPSRIPSLEPGSAECSSSQPAASVEGSISTPSAGIPTQPELAPVPASSQKYPFHKLQDPSYFETFLEDPEDMEYDELYHRLEKVSDCLQEYQKEYKAIDDEIFAYEARERAGKARLEEQTKFDAEAARLRDDEAREKVRDEYKSKLSLKGREWADFLQEFDSSDPEHAETLRHFSNLRNPQFMAQVNKKRSRPLRTTKKTVRFDGVPLAEVKPTKEEMLIEKRKKGKLTDPMHFDDMKQADIYGAEYSSHNKHLGAQPLGGDKSRASQKKKAQAANGTDAAASDFEGPSSGRKRAPRSKARRYDDGDAEDTEEPEEEQLPAKRQRKPTKLVEDGGEAGGGSSSQSRGATPSAKLFPSGKRIGRPPTKKSTLQAVEMAPASPNPEQASRNASQELAPSQQAELEQAAEWLVNQTVTDKADAALVKKKHAGGRPRKTAQTARTRISAEPSAAALTKPKNKGGRPKKAILQEVKLESASHDSAIQLGDENGVMQSTEHRDSVQMPSSSAGSGRFKRNRMATETGEDPVVVENAPVKKRKTRATSHAENMAPSKATSTGLSQLGGSDSETDANPKRKRATTSTISKAASVVSDTGDGGPGSKKRKASTTASGRASKKPKTEKPADIDYATSTPEEIKEYERQLAAYKKSQKLSESLRARWANGGMKQAQATRLANNQLKRQQKEAEAEASGAANAAPVAEGEAVQAPAIVPPAPKEPPKKSTILKLPLSGAKESGARLSAKAAASNSVAAAPVPKKTAPKRAKAASPPTPPARTHARQMKLDGSDDSEDDILGMSEYDRFQAITSPGNGGNLPGKRVRKSVRASLAFESEEDTNGAETTDNDEDEYSF